MPPIDPPAAPSPSDTQKMAAIVVKQEAQPEHIPQWAIKTLVAVVAMVMIPGSIAVVSWVLGGIHSRLSENEKNIQMLKEERAAINARLGLIEGVNRRQWELLSENKDKISGHSH